MIQYSIAGACKFGITKFGYHSGRLLCQVGKRLSKAKFGLAKFGATKFGLDNRVTRLRTLRKNSLQIRDSLEEVPSCSFAILNTLTDPPGDGQIVLIAIGTLQNRIFGGHLANPKQSQFNTDWYQYDCTAESFTKHLRRRLVAATYQNQTAGEIVQALLSAYSAFTWAGDMQDGEDIEEIKFSYVSVLDACNDLARRSGYVFYIDPKREAHFKAQSKHSAPWDVSASEIYTGLSIDEDSSELKNRVIVRYSELTSITDSFKGDGEQEKFFLSEQPHTITSLKVDGAPVTYDTKYAVDNSANDFSVRYGAEKYIDTVNHAVLTASNILEIVYTGKHPARVIVNDTAAQSARASIEGGAGIYEAVIEDRDISSQADALLRAQEELSNYSSVRVSASYRRRETVFSFFTNCLKVGMQQNITARGRNHTLIIDALTITVATHADNSRLAFWQEVTLSPVMVKNNLTAVFRQLFQDSTQQVEEPVEVEYEFNLDDL